MFVPVLTSLPPATLAWAPPVLPVLGSWVVGVLATLFVIVSLFMMLIVLIQRPKGGGLSGAFGGGAGGGSAQSAFGSKVGDVLTWATVGAFVLFLGLAMGLTWTITPEHAATQSQQTASSPASTTPSTGGAAATPPTDTDVPADTPATPDDSLPATTPPTTPAPAESESATQ